MTIKRTMSLTLLALLCITKQSMVATPPGTLAFLNTREMTGKQTVSTFFIECLNGSQELRDKTQEEKNDLLEELKWDITAYLYAEPNEEWWSTLRIRAGAFIIANTDAETDTNVLICQAVECVDNELTQFLLAHGKRPYTREYGWTPLHTVACIIMKISETSDACKIQAMTEILLEAGVDINARATANNQTAEEMVKKFLKKQIRPTPLAKENAIAKCENFLRVVQKWRASQPSNSTEPIIALTQEIQPEAPQ